LGIYRRKLKDENTRQNKYCQKLSHEFSSAMHLKTKLLGESVINSKAKEFLDISQASGTLNRLLFRADSCGFVDQLLAFACGDTIH
jgi:hypothetical protein